jgi:hypothetical protein
MKILFVFLAGALGILGGAGSGRASAPPAAEPLRVAKPLQIREATRHPSDNFCARTDLAALDGYQRGVVKAHCPGVSVPGEREALTAELLARADRVSGDTLANFAWARLNPEDVFPIALAEEWAAGEAGLQTKDPILQAAGLYRRHRLTHERDFVRLALTSFGCADGGIAESLAGVVKQALLQDTTLFLEVLAAAQKALEEPSALKDSCLKQDREQKTRYVDAVASAAALDARPAEIAALRKKLAAAPYRAHPLVKPLLAALAEAESESEGD